jgi:hypothetical protein
MSTTLFSNKSLGANIGISAAVLVVSALALGAVDQSIRKKEAVPDGIGNAVRVTQGVLVGAAALSIGLSVWGFVHNKRATQF